MNKPGHIELETLEEDCKVEITDLDPPDCIDSRKTSRLESTLLHWQRSPNRRYYIRYWRLTSTLAILLLLATLFSLNKGLSSSIVSGFKTAFFPSSHFASPVGTLPAPPLPPQDGIACLAEAAWSPDGTSIAVLGYQDCPQSTYVLGMVNLYEARSKHLVSQLQPDVAILRALGRPLPSSQGRPAGKQPPRGSTGGDTEPLVSYEHVIWSPDDQRLAVTFEVAAQQPSLHGVVLANRDGGSMQVLLEQPQQHAASPFYAEWELDQSANIPPSAFSLKLLSPALAYHWGENGRLVPETLLTNTFAPAVLLSPPGPVGNPDGTKSFTIWQPGSANLISLADSSSAYTMYTWSTDFAAWSPDGRYLVDGISLSGLLQPPGKLFPSHKALVASGMDQALLLPIRDAALLAVVERATAIAWSPDGRVLAAYAVGNIVNLYNCTNGHKLASLRVHTNSVAPPAQAVLMRWSPDSSHLLLSSVPWGLVSLWSPGQLPQ